jgi:hypothetical protein
VRVSALTTEPQRFRLHRGIPLTDPSHLCEGNAVRLRVLRGGGDGVGRRVVGSGVVAAGARCARTSWSGVARSPPAADRVAGRKHPGYRGSQGASTPDSGVVETGSGGVWLWSAVVAHVPTVRLRW